MRKILLSPSALRKRRELQSDINCNLDEFIIMNGWSDMKPQNSAIVSCSSFYEFECLAQRQRQSPAIPRAGRSHRLPRYTQAKNKNARRATRRVSYLISFQHLKTYKQHYCVICVHNQAKRTSPLLLIFSSRKHRIFKLCHHINSLFDFNSEELSFINIYSIWFSEFSVFNQRRMWVI